MSRVSVRRVNEWDSAAMLKIYDYYIKNTHATLEEITPPLADVVEQIDLLTYWYGWVLCDIEGKMSGYAAASPHTEPVKWSSDKVLRADTEGKPEKDAAFYAAAYEVKSVDLAVYVHKDKKRGKVGKALYHLLLRMLEAGNCEEAYAYVPLPNEEARLFHESMGFTEQKVWEKSGHKNGKYYDILEMKKNLQPLAPGERKIKPYLIDRDIYEGTRAEAEGIVMLSKGRTNA